MIQVKAPNDYAAHAGLTKIFLAGSIEMGMAEHWQSKIARGLSDTESLVLNPRREDWDAGWVQSIDNPHFRRQVEWELDGLDAADAIAFYFSPGTKAPVTMLELGIQLSRSPQKLIVCCPKGFWRKGNIDVLCARYKVEQAETLELLIEALKRRL